MKTASSDPSLLLNANTQQPELSTACSGQMLPLEEAVSAWLDGEADDAQWTALWVESARQDTLTTWHRYNVIGDVLRASAPALGQQSPQEFLATVRARLPAQPPLQVVHPLAAVGDVPTIPRSDAANDAVFRWKWVAGLASLSAVLAVAWSMLGMAVPDATGTSLPAGQWAAQNPSTTLTATSTGFVINSTQGPVMRDPQLERLMAEHRQHGAVSALQVPAGFVRNASHDVSGR